MKHPYNYLTLIRLIGNRSITLLSIKRGRVTRSKDVQSLQKQLQNNCNVSQDRILKTINISSFTAHNIVKGFRESGAISVHSNKAEHQSWVPAIFVPSGSSWALKHLQVLLQHTWLCHAHMQVKAVSCKENSACEHDPETLLFFFGASVSKKSKTVLWSDGLNFRIIGTTWTLHPLKEASDLLLELT